MAKRKKKAARKKAPARGAKQTARKAKDPSVTVSLAFVDAKAAIDFYRSAFGATEIFRLTEPGGTKIGHAEIKIGNSVIFLSDEYPDFGVRSPAAIGGSPARLNILVKNADTAVARAVTAGAKVIRPVNDEFYGHRVGVIEDPFGYRWTLSQELSKLSPKKMQKAWDKMGAG
jgi:PhnB protein